MLCGKWETFPREFAKCRRCRKAKYCCKDCQSRAWSDGHRFWCSARDEEGESSAHAAGSHGARNDPYDAPSATGQTLTGDESGDGATGSGGSRQDRVERRQARERERQRVTAAAAAAVAALMPNTSLGAAAAASRYVNPNGPSVRPPSH